MDSKERKKHFNSALKAEAKKLNLKSRQGIFFTPYKDFFLEIIPHLDGPTSAVFEAKLKPFCFDDILWTVLRMEENKQAPLSLRANGAFAFRPYPVSSRKICYHNLESLEQEAKKELAESLTILQDFADSFADLEKFIRFGQEAAPRSYDAALAEMLWLLHEGLSEQASQEAQTLLAQGKKGSFSNAGKNIYEWIAFSPNL